MKKAIILNNIKADDLPHYILNAVGEEAGHYFEATEESIKWYESLNAPDTDWLLYLVKKSGQFGLMALQEIPHRDCDDIITNQVDDINSKWFTSDPDVILEHITRVMEEIGEKIEFEVLVGNQTGFASSHEAYIFFPMETSAEKVAETLTSINTEGLYSFDV